MEKIDGNHPILKYLPLSGSDIERLGNLVQGEKYRVIKSFIDAAGDEHENGEEWVFCGSAYNGYDGEYILWVRTSPAEEWILPLRTQANRQREIIQNFTNYVLPIT